MDREDSAGLVQRALTGDQTALTRLVAGLTPVVQARVARTLLARRSRLGSGRHVHQEVEDLSQDVFLSLFSRDARVLRAWDSERGLSLENFVGLVAERFVVSALRSGKRSFWKESPGLPEELDVPSPECSPEAFTASREELGLLLDRMREEVSPLGWRLFDLLFVKELSLPEVKMETGLSDDAIYAWRSRLRRVAQRLLHEMSGSEAQRRSPWKDGKG